MQLIRTVFVCAILSKSVEARDDIIDRCKINDSSNFWSNNLSYHHRGNTLCTFHGHNRLYHGDGVVDARNIHVRGVRVQTHVVLTVLL